MKDIIANFCGMDAGTRVRTITAAFTAVVDCLTVFGVIALSDEQAQSILNVILVAVTAFVWAYCSHWKNNNFTEAACKGSGITRMEKQDVINEPMQFIQK